MSKLYQQVTLSNGETRWRCRVDVSRSGEPRRQVTVTRRTLAACKAERHRLLGERDAGTLVAPSMTTTRELFAAWLAGHERMKASTRATYEQAANLWLNEVGDVKAQQLTKDRLISTSRALLAGGRRAYGRNRALSVRTLQVGMRVLKAAFADAVHQGTVKRNPWALLTLPEYQPRERATWNAEQMRTFLRHLEREDDPDYALYRLACLGARRGEVVGARWDDFDLDNGVWRIRWTRTLAGGTAVEGGPKTQRGNRDLGLSPADVKALTALRDRQDRERAEAGQAYADPCALCAGRHLWVDALGRPGWPQSFGKRFAKLARAAGLPPIRLHDLRHSYAEALLDAGVPIGRVSRVLGHVKPSFTMDTYARNAGGHDTLPDLMA